MTGIGVSVLVTGARVDVTVLVGVSVTVTVFGGRVIVTVSSVVGDGFSLVGVTDVDVVLVEVGGTTKVSDCLCAGGGLQVVRESVGICHG
ncbi:hypothetical protein GCM10027157_11200 [Corynebacterium aquatimens]